LIVKGKVNFVFLFLTLMIKIAHNLATCIYNLFKLLLINLQLFLVSILKMGELVCTILLSRYFLLIQVNVFVVGLD